MLRQYSSKCVPNVSWMCPECLTNMSWMCLECVLNMSRMCPECMLNANVPRMCPKLYSGHFVTKWLYNLDFLLHFLCIKGSQTEQLLSKKFVDQKHSLDCDEMNILWPNDSIILIEVIGRHWETYKVIESHGESRGVDEIH